MVVHTSHLNTQESEEGKFKASFFYLWVVESPLRFEIPGVLLDSFPQTDTVIFLEIYGRKKELWKTSWSGGFLPWSVSYNLQIDFIWIQKLRKGRRKAGSDGVCDSPSSWEVKTERIRNAGLSLVNREFKTSLLKERDPFTKRGGMLFEKSFFPIYLLIWMPWNS